MTIKTLAAAVALTLTPMLAMAEGCNYGKQAAMSCSDGSSFDAASGKCVPTTS